MKLLNLTQHKATPEQLEAGVVDLPPDLQVKLKELLDFKELPGQQEIYLRAETIRTMYEEFGKDSGETLIGTMIGGAPFFMKALHETLEDHGIPVKYSFSARVSEEKTLENGTVEKVSVFKHLGFV